MYKFNLQLNFSIDGKARMRHVLLIDNVYFCHVPLVGYERREYLRSILLKNCVAVKHGDVVENT